MKWLILGAGNGKTNLVLVGNYQSRIIQAKLHVVAAGGKVQAVAPEKINVQILALACV